MFVVIRFHQFHQFHQVTARTVYQVMSPDSLSGYEPGRNQGFVCRRGSQPVGVSVQCTFRPEDGSRVGNEGPGYRNR